MLGSFDTMVFEKETILQTTYLLVYESNCHFPRVYSGVRFVANLTF